VVDGRSIMVKIDDVGALASQGEGFTAEGYDTRDGRGGGKTQWTGGGKAGRARPRPMETWTNRVFYAGAPFHCTEGALRSYFAELGTIRSFTVFWLNDGRHRGMGVCTYSSNIEAQEALARGIVVEGRPLFLQEDVSQFAEGVQGQIGGTRGAQQALAYGTSEASSYGPSARQKRSGSRSSPYDQVYDAYNFEAYHIDVDPNKAVFFANVPCETTETHIRARFEACGPVKHVILFMTPDGKSRGMGLVEHTTQAGAMRAYNVLHDQPVSGRPIVVDEYRPSHPAWE